MEGRKQMGELEIGRCDLCGRDYITLHRKYFRYDIPCACHSQSHFVLIRHCVNCTPREPAEIIVRFSRDQIHTIEQALRNYTEKIDGDTDDEYRHDHQ